MKRVLKFLYFFLQGLKLQFSSNHHFLSFFHLSTCFIFLLYIHKFLLTTSFVHFRFLPSLPLLISSFLAFPLILPVLSLPHPSLLQLSILPFLCAILVPSSLIYILSISFISLLLGVSSVLSSSVFRSCIISCSSSLPTFIISNLLSVSCPHFPPTSCWALS